MKKTGKAALILYGLCAVLWTVRAAIDIACKAYTDSPVLFVLNELCAVIWIAAFVVQLRRCRKDD